MKFPYRKEPATPADRLREAERRLLRDPMRSKHLAELRRLLGDLQQEAKKKGLDKMSMRQIDAEIATVRKSRSRKKASNQPAV
jgi:hypothetical protein